MKVSKEAQRTARQLFRLTLKKGKVDEKTVRKIVAKITEDKPRHYLGILTAYYRMLRLEAARRHAIVESASQLSNEQCDEIRTELQKVHGKDLTAEFILNPDLIGGMRVKLGSTVWDGSVKSRLDNLRSALLA
jgi:F-type H+-transporting ATPase subunit delta